MARASIRISGGRRRDAPPSISIPMSRPSASKSRLILNATSSKPSTVSATAAADDLHRGRQKLRLEFELPRGSYATIIVKRLTLKDANNIAVGHVSYVPDDVHTS